MGVKFTGLKELEQELTEKFSPEKMQRIVDKALVAGGRRVLHVVKQQQAKYRDTGATVSEATLSDPMTLNGQRIVKIHWRGPKNRYSIIHLQENGFYNKDGTFNNPPSKGALQRAIIEGKEVYFQTVKSELEKEFR